MKILITGGLGFIGRNLVAQLLKEQANKITIIDNLTTQVHGPNPKYSEITEHPQVTFVRADICDFNILNPLIEGVDLIYHLAAETGTGQSMYQIEHYYRTNVLGTATLLESIVKNVNRPKALVLASSRSVYGEGAYVRAIELDNKLAQRFFPKNRSAADMKAGKFEFDLDGGSLVAVATKEDDPLNPQSLYAASKLAQEQMCQIACKTVGTKFTALRFQNVYGPGQSLRNPYTGIISIFANLLRQGGEIDIFEDGQESRDFVFIDDVVKALVAANHLGQGDPEIINVGSGIKTSVNELTELLQCELGLTGKSRVSGKFRQGDIRHCFADTLRMRTALSLSHLTALHDGIHKTLEWVSSQPFEADRSKEANSEFQTMLATSQ